MKLVAWIILFSCGAQASDMIELRYQDQDADGAPYLTRVSITERYLRMDEGDDNRDFILLDRKSRTLTNVMREQKMLMRLPPSKLPTAPDAYRVDEKITPVRSGTVRVQVFSDDKLCSETVVAQKLLPDAAKALAEYKSALAYTQWQTYRNTPVEVRQSCDLAQHVWGAAQALKHGLPLEERDYSGRTRQLLASARKQIKSGLFKVPGNYTVTQPPSADSVEIK